MGYNGLLVPLGSSALASTTLNEQGFDPDVIETALAHVDNNEVLRAYNRADYLEHRKIMMRWWPEYIERAAIGSQNISINRGTQALPIAKNIAIFAIDSLLLNGIRKRSNHYHRPQPAPPTAGVLYLLSFACSASPAGIGPQASRKPT